MHGERPQGSVRAPAAQSTVIETAQYAGEVRSVSELLLGSPGVSVHALGGPGQTATLSLRGASADESLILLDGIPLSGPGGGAPDLAALPATLLERMIVTRGVLGAQFGAGALGGAVELVPRSARAGKTFGAEVSAGSFGTGRLALDAALPLGNGSALVALQGDRTAGGFQYARQLTPEIAGAPFFGFQRENADATRGSGLVRLTQEIGAATGIDVLLQGSLGERGLPGPASAPTPRTREIDEGSVGGLRLRGMAGSAAWSVRAFGRLDRIELRGAQAFGDCADGTPDCPRDDQRSSSGRGEAELALPAGDAQLFKLLLSGRRRARARHRDRRPRPQPSRRGHLRRPRAARRVLAPSRPPRGEGGRGRRRQPGPRGAVASSAVDAARRLGTLLPAGHLHRALSRSRRRRRQSAAPARARLVVGRGRCVSQGRPEALRRRLLVGVPRPHPLPALPCPPGSSPSTPDRRASQGSSCRP